jgi:hypothetical protein
MESYPPLIINMSQAPQQVGYLPSVGTYPQTQCCGGCSKQQPKKLGTGELPVSLTTVTYVVSALMGTIMIVCGYIQCNDGTFDCSTGKVPDISHVMGRAPLNKLYAIMLTFYAFNKQANVRSFHHSLQGIVSEGTRQWMVILGIMCCLFGPCIGYWDVYFNMPVHCFVVALFCVGEVGYALTAIAAVNSARDKFPQSAQSSIDTLVTCRMITIVLGVVTLGAKVIGLNLDPYGSWIEWILFNMSFYIIAVLSSVMPYNDVVVPETKEE